MKLKIIERGYDGFTGYMGITQFVDAVSVNDISHREACMLAALIKVADVETGRELSAFDQERAVWNSADVKQPEPLKHLDKLPEQKKSAPASTPEPAYTREALEAIADKGGIGALRTVGERFAVKNVSIVGLIDGILEAQAAHGA